MKQVFLVTGGAGHLGNTIIRELAKKDVEVRALLLPQEMDVTYLPKQVRRYCGDVTNCTSMKEFFSVKQEDQAIVIHAAGIVSIASRFNQKVYDVNVGGTKNIIAQCLKHRVEKLIYISSVHAIIERPKGETIREEDCFDPKQVIGLYAQTKAEATQAVLNSVDEGLFACVVHPSGIIGPYDYGHGHLTQLVIDYANGSLFAGIDGGYDFVDVRDVAKGVLLCCEKGRNKECYILSNRFYKVKDVLETLHRVTQKRRVLLYLPHGLIKRIVPLLERFAELRHKTPLYTSYSIDTLKSNAAFSHEKADRELGYTTRPFEKTIKDTYDWLKENNRLK